MSQVERAGDKGGHSALHPELYKTHVDASGVEEKELIRKLDRYLVS